ncbi:uroporphyrinogen-III C-methyltransferase; uroporphyrinogen-III synthase [Chthonomonas calidirosea]|uniref:uroporphyrinogen-III C-methyltransferase n=1 Tax=Chthonomonas calidirosea (strain DSM 23976 / ICMP 18418 / T49) TaxID=1303518 RepID=S0ESZ5_CHTCT|nr:uroporphyrinogen-III C-methyltransferase [Chthonomonas calidirosea]CCW34531.1 uroporphyrinogen-III synthase/uroporphyrinogen-III C-methyltransferase [Chthonomonas calidirosea T49]CEK14517.1 uroporphyrinogen-III C-methyltransferase; uroporphyrinogen-III synthase [Chthonomonas calidirosea]
MLEAEENQGVVYLIGAGPGDPGLLTLRGRELLMQADIVVYDRLVHPAVLDYARPEALRIYVGKASARHTLTQEEINALLIRHAQEGKRVARLKGGDPFVFGRGGEEAEACRAAGVPYIVVPGITSAIAAPAYAGIPVTHRDAASSFCVITGHERDDGKESGRRTTGSAEGRRDWARLAHAADTLIFLMGVEALPEIVARLQEHGRDPQTPVALVQWGTWPQQRVVSGTLADIVDRIREAGLGPPAVCVVGEVVRLRERLRWFDDPQRQPLFGKRILVTRAREQASSLVELLRIRGAEVLEYPTIRIERLKDTNELDKALQSLNGYAWIVITSVNTVPVIAERLEALQLDARAFSMTKVAAIGPATANALREKLGIRADFVPTEAVAEALIDQWPDSEMRGKRVLLPRAREAREVLPERLRAMGAIVDVIPVYETVAVKLAEAVVENLMTGSIDAITFTASSTVKNLMQALSRGADDLEVRARLRSVCLAAIGPVTGQTLKEYGFEPTIVAEEHTIAGLVKALESYFAQRD